MGKKTDPDRMVVCDVDGFIALVSEAVRECPHEQNRQQLVRQGFREWLGRQAWWLGREVTPAKRKGRAR